MMRTKNPEKERKDPKNKIRNQRKHLKNLNQKNLRKPLKKNNPRRKEAKREEEMRIFESLPDLKMKNYEIMNLIMKFFYYTMKFFFLNFLYSILSGN